MKKRALQSARPVGISYVIGLLAAGAAMGCGDDTTGGETPGSTMDSSMETTPDSSDSGLPTPDTAAPETSTMATVDANGPDTATTSVDAGIDATVDSAIPVVDASSGDATVVDPGSDARSAVDAAKDTGTDSGPIADAAVDAAVDAPIDAGFCQSQSGLAFCADFDESNSVLNDAGLMTGWSEAPADPADLSISSTESSSTPNSLFVEIPQNGSSRSAKVVDMVSPTNGVAQAIYEFDMFISHVPAGTDAPGGFATDLQFVDGDRFGYRIGIFSNGTTLSRADLEHNDAVTGAPDNPDPRDIGLAENAWQHVKMVVAFASVASDAGDGGSTNQAAFQLYLNGGTTPAVAQTFPAPFAKAPYVRLAAGLVYGFSGNGENDWGIYYDNFTLKVQ